MKKSELVRIVSKKTGITNAKVSSVVDAFFETLAEELIHGNRYAHEGFGSFSIKRKKDRVARNPLTGEVLKVDACYAPKFTPSKILKDRIKKIPLDDE